MTYKSWYSRYGTLPESLATICSVTPVLGLLIRMRLSPLLTTNTCPQLWLLMAVTLSTGPTCGRYTYV